MIFGDQLILTRKGLHVSNKSLETIGVFPNTQVHLLPFRSFEFREGEPAYSFPLDLLITPIAPNLWPFVARFVLRLRNRPRMLEHALEFFAKRHINVLFAECTRSGHHHSALNLLGEVTSIEGMSIPDLFSQLKDWAAAQEETHKGIYDSLAQDMADGRRECIQEWIKRENRWEFYRPGWFQALEHFMSLKERAPESSGSAEPHDVTAKDLSERATDAEHEGEPLRDAAKTLHRHYSDNPALQEVLEGEIRRVRPIARDIRDRLMRGRISPEKAYGEAEKHTLPLKILLRAILTYKRLLSERYKLEIIEAALDMASKEGGSSYLYNIRYYRDILRYPFFNHRSFFYTSSDKKGWRDRVGQIAESLEGLAPERIQPVDFETRLDLDPIVVTPVEFLCHAFYHRAYEDDFQSTAKNNMIPFSDPPHFPKHFLDWVLPEEKSATIAIASRNTDDLTLRMCPIPAKQLQRFVQVDLERYSRNCVDECIRHGRSRAAEERKEKEETEIPASALREVVGGEEVGRGNADKGRCDEKVQAPGESLCEGTTAGLMRAFAQSIGEEDTEPGDTRCPLNIWRAYNKTFVQTGSWESGSISFLAHATGPQFLGFPANLTTKIETRMAHHVEENVYGQHVRTGAVKAKGLSGGRVFVSLSLKHPMSKKWLKCIQEVGEEMGFAEVGAVETYTQPVTPIVAEKIKTCHAMIQVLALPSATPGEAGAVKTDKTEMIWLHAEYLSAITNDLKVVRLIERNSLDPKELPIGKDHPSYYFSIQEPFENFREYVRRAFENLREELADTLGLS